MGSGNSWARSRCRQGPKLARTHVELVVGRLLALYFIKVGLIKFVAEVEVVIKQIFLSVLLSMQKLLPNLLHDFLGLLYIHTAA